MKVAVLWPGLSGYLNACLKELASRGDLFVAHKAPVQDAPYDVSEFNWIADQLLWRTYAELDGLEDRLRKFSPDVLLIAGWAIPPYRRAAASLSGKCLRVMTMDNPWLGTARQRMAVLVGRRWLHRLAEAMWVPGERQAMFAKRLGFTERNILRGSYSCDYPATEAIFLERKAQNRSLPHSFIFVGRLVGRKGIDTLVSAYAEYRSLCAKPWPLVCCGTGPLRPMLENQPGISDEGFLQPAQIGEMLAAAGCLVLPSIYEAWAVVVHEAASAGLLVLASENVGAAVHLVQTNYNGFLFGAKDVSGLARAMLRVSSLTDEQLEAMSVASHSLSAQFSPKRWADTLVDAVTFLKPLPPRSVRA